VYCCRIQWHSGPGGVFCTVARLPAPASL